MGDDLRSSDIRELLGGELSDPEDDIVDNDFNLG